MSLSKIEKSKIIKTVDSKGVNTGSSASVISLLTEEINRLSAHLIKNKKDFISRRGLSIKVAQRKSLVSYMSRSNPEECKKLLKTLKI
jgi:small subunit ribosomal protein S15